MEAEPGCEQSFQGRTDHLVVTKISKDLHVVNGVVSEGRFALVTEKHKLKVDPSLTDGSALWCGEVVRSRFTGRREIPGVKALKGITCFKYKSHDDADANNNLVCKILEGLRGQLAYEESEEHQLLFGGKKLDFNQVCIDTGTMNVRAATPDLQCILSLGDPQEITLLNLEQRPIARHELQPGSLLIFGEEHDCQTFRLSGDGRHASVELRKRYENYVLSDGPSSAAI